MSKKCEFDGCEKLAQPGEVYSYIKKKAISVCDDHWEILTDERGGYWVDCPCCGVQFAAEC